MFRRDTNEKGFFERCIRIPENVCGYTKPYYLPAESLGFAGDVEDWNDLNAELLLIFEKQADVQKLYDRYKQISKTLRKMKGQRRKRQEEDEKEEEADEEAKNEPEQEIQEEEEEEDADEEAKNEPEQEIQEEEEAKNEPEQEEAEDELYNEAEAAGKQREADARLAQLMQLGERRRSPRIQETEPKAKGVPKSKKESKAKPKTRPKAKPKAKPKSKSKKR